MSGLSNVLYWLEVNQIEAEPNLAEHILHTAKAANRSLTDQEVLDLIDAYTKR